MTSRVVGLHWRGSVAPAYSTKIKGLVRDCFASYLATPRNDVTGKWRFAICHDHVMATRVILSSPLLVFSPTTTTTWNCFPEAGMVERRSQRSLPLCFFAWNPGARMPGQILHPAIIAACKIGAWFDPFAADKQQPWTKNNLPWYSA